MAQDRRNYQLVCNYRNVHHNLVRDKNLNVAIDEYQLKRIKNLRNLGCMNLDNNQKESLFIHLVYLEIIWCRCLALSNKIRKTKKCVFISTGGWGN